MWFLSRITLLALVVTAVPACTSARDNDSTVFANGRPVGEIRGTMLVNKQIQRRVLDSDAPSTDKFLIEQVAGPEVFGMRGLLGEYSEGGAHAEFRGGEANPFGMLLWHQVAARFAEGLAATCDNGAGSTNLKFFGSSGFQMSGAFSDKVFANCDSNLSEAELKTNASAMWRAFMGIGASSEEGSWVDFFSNPTGGFVAANGNERVSAMVMSMMLNPHFLLEK